jgi:small subunit ribosomal protein S20
VANVPSAEKRNRQRIKRRARNQFHLSTMRTYVKRVRTAIESKDGKLAEMLKAAVAIIDKAASKGVIDKKTASRKISRLTKAASAK